LVTTIGVILLLIIEELFFEVIILVSAIYFYIVSISLPSFSPVIVMKPSWWPQIILWLIIIPDILLIYRNLLIYKKKKLFKITKDKKAPKVWLWIILEAINILFFIYFLNYLGFLSSAIIFCIISVAIIADKFKINYFGIAILIAFVSLLFFGTLLGIPFPRGYGFLREISYWFY
jgi:hypothetical protein